MAARISIVIPTLNAQDTLPACLAALVEGLPAGLIREVIVSDGGSTDDTKHIAEATGATVVTGNPSRGGQLRRGSAIAKGDWLMVLHADTVLDPGWSQVVGTHLDYPGAGTAFFRLAFRATGFAPMWVAGWANFRARLFALPYGDQGLLVRARDYHAAGGFPDQPLMEDVAMVRALPKPFSPLPVRAVTSAERYQSAGWLRRGTRNIWTLLRYFAGTDPEVLARAYRG
jgi:rSAM/selenodomain-associated transferase 2